jgi:hypothetical protein
MAGLILANNPVRLPNTTSSIAPFIAPQAVCPKTKTSFAPETAHANSMLPSRSSLTTFPATRPLNGSGKMLTLYEVATELSRRLYSTFLKDPANNGRRPVYGAEGKFQSDPHWRDLILFYEYFHGDNGAGIGASHQTGWTGLVARLIGLSVGIDPKQFLNFEHRPVLREVSSPQAGAAAVG